MIEVEQEQVLKLEYVLEQASEGGYQQRNLHTFDPDDPRTRQTYFTYQDGSPYAGAFNKDFKTDTYYTGVTFGQWSEKLVELKKPVKIDPNDTKKLPTLESELRTYENSFVGVDNFEFLRNLSPDDRVDRPLEQIALMNARALPISQYPRGLVPPNGFVATVDQSFQPLQTVQPTQPATQFQAPAVARPVLQPTADELMMRAPAMAPAEAPAEAPAMAPAMAPASQDDPIVQERMRILLRDLSTLQRDIDDKLAKLPLNSKYVSRLNTLKLDLMRSIEGSYMEVDTLRSMDSVLTSFETVWGRMKRTVDNEIKASETTAVTMTPARRARTQGAPADEAGPSSATGSTARVISEEGVRLLSPVETQQREEALRESSPRSSTTTEVVDGIAIPIELQPRKMRDERKRYVMLYQLTNGLLSNNLYILASSFKHARRNETADERLSQNRDEIAKLVESLKDMPNRQSNAFYIEKVFNVPNAIAQKYAIANDIVARRLRQV
jgi:hypothetical protein